MKITKTLMTIIILLSTPIVYADIFSPSSNNDIKIESAVRENRDGFYDRAGIDYNTQPVRRDPQLYSSHSLSLGCSGFDYRSSFLNQFSTEALSDALSSTAQGVMAAAPMLLLEYASPTLADLIKHFNSITNVKLGLRYTQCEDIERAVSDKFDQLRKKSEKACLDNQPKDDLEKAIMFCKRQSDPFAFLTKENGEPLYKGGEINIIKTVLNKIKRPQEDKDLASQTIPETTITKDGIQRKEEEKSIEDIIKDRREKYIKELVVLFDSYQQSKTISNEQLKKFSVPGVPLTENQLRNISILNEEKATIVLAKIASNLSVYETTKKYEKNLEILRTALLDPEISEEYKEPIKQEYQFTKDKIEHVRTNRKFLDEYADVMTSILNEAEKKRLELLMITDNPNSVDEDRIRSDLLLLPDFDSGMIVSVS